MTTTDPDPEAEPADFAEEHLSDEGMAPLVDELQQLVGEVKAFAEAEIAFQKARVKVAGLGARNVALFGVCAFVFAVFALGALIVGLLIALTPIVTAWGATAIVVGTLVLGVVLSVRGALSGWRRIRSALTDNGSDPS